MRTALVCALVLLASCQKHEPPAPTPQQSAELNDAGSMLDNLANEEGPEANAAGPSNSSN